MFSCLKKARAAGFVWLEYRPDLGVHLVEKTFERSDGQMVKAVALVRAVDRGEA